MKLRHLSDSTLLAEFKRVVIRERWAIATVIAYIVEIDRRKLYLDKACSSMTTFCIERMGYSVDAAANRVGVARVVQQYPLALDMLRRGELTMTTIRTLSPVLTRENHRERLAAAVGKTKLEVQELVAGWAPKPDVPTSIRDITPPSPPDLLLRMQAAPASRVEQPSAPASSSGAASASSSASTSASARTAYVDPARPAPLPKPLSVERYLVQFTTDKEERELIMHARDLFRHSIPDGDIKKIFLKSLRKAVADAEARKFGKLKRSKPANTTSELPLQQTARTPTATSADKNVTTSRTATRDMKRDIAERSGCQCEYHDDEGNRCQSTAWLEEDHMDGYAKVHKTDGARMRHLCRAHNQGRNSGHDDLARSSTSAPVQLTLPPSNAGEVREGRTAYLVGPRSSRFGSYRQRMSQALWRDESAPLTMVRLATMSARYPTGSTSSQ